MNAFSLSMKKEFMMYEKRQSAKKRLMFIQREDYNFLTYNFLLILNEMDCTSESKKFNDFRRIAYLIEFISNSSDFATYNSIELSNIYLRAQLKKKLLSHLIVTLKNKKFLDVSLNTTHKTLDVWLVKENIPTDFFDNVIFQQEINNFKNIKKYASISKSQILITMIKKLYTDKGVMTWEV